MWLAIERVASVISSNPVERQNSMRFVNKERIRQLKGDAARLFRLKSSRCFDSRRCKWLERLPSVESRWTAAAMEGKAVPKRQRVSPAGAAALHWHVDIA